MSSEIRTVTKIDAARQQLETAIKLFFNDESFVAVHTLCSASFNILKDISKKRDGEFAFELNVRVKPEHLGLFWKQFNAPASFFKHANRDPDPEAQLEFNEKANDLKLMFCCWGYKDVTNTKTPIMETYMKWMLAFYPEYFKLEQKDNQIIKSAQTLFDTKTWDRAQRKSAGKLLLNGVLARPQ